MKKFIIGAIIVALVGFIVYKLVYKTAFDNPPIEWKLSPHPDENTGDTYGPRNQRTKEGGGVHQDNGTERKGGTATGVVFFGPDVSGGAGHAQSRVSKVLNCGAGGKFCRIKVTVGSGSMVAGEYLRVSASRSPSGEGLQSVRVASEGSTKEFDLDVPECGNVEVVVAFEEDPGGQAGIQSRFTVQISKYGCAE